MNHEPGVVIAGAGAAGATAAGALRKAGYLGPLTVVGGEPGRPYNRTTVNKSLLQGSLSRDDVILPEASTPATEWTVDDPAVALDSGRRSVTLASGRVLRFSRLVIATGARPRMWTGRAEAGVAERVVTLRHSGDSAKLRKLLRLGVQPPARDTRSVTILGAGLIGLETATVLSALGINVHLISVETMPMRERLGSIAGEWLLGRHGDHVQTDFGRTVTNVGLSDAGQLISHLDDGGSVESDALVVAIGVTPGTNWLETSGLDISDGIAVDERLRVRDRDAIYAAGDVARLTDSAGRGDRIENWTNAVDQGRLAALNLLHDLGMVGDDPGPCRTVPMYTTRLYGTKFTIVGQGRSFTKETVIDGEPGTGKFTVALSDPSGRVVGAVGVGPGSIASLLKDAVASGDQLRSVLERRQKRGHAGTPVGA